MSKTRSYYVYALLISFACATTSVAAFAQNNSQDDSAVPSFQLTSPVAALAQSDASVPNFQLASPIAFLGQPSGTLAMNSSNAPMLAYNSAPALGSSYQQTPQATPAPPQVAMVTKQIKHKVRHWHIGGRIGVGFSPELFMFGLQSQIGPIFSPRLVLRPNAEFGFGELTDMYDVNLEAAYFLREKVHGRWTPYFGAGPSLNFVHQGTTTEDVSFSDFSYKTGFNVFIGAQKDRTFVEMKTSLWSGKTPVLRLFLGYNF